MPPVAFDVSEVLGNAHVPQIEHLDTIHLLDLSQRLARCVDSHTIEQKRLTASTDSFHCLVHIDGVTVQVARRPVIQSLLKESILQEVIISRHVVCRFAIERTEARQCHLHSGLQVLTRLVVEELTHGIQVIQISAEALQPTEHIRTDAFKVTETTFQGVFRIRLQAVEYIHIRCVLTNRHDGDNTLTVRAFRIHTDQSIPFLESLFRREAFDLRRKVLESQPIETILAIRQVTYSNLLHPELIRLRHVPVILSVRITVVLLYLDIVTATKGVVQLAILSLQHHLTGAFVVVIHHHHVREDTVGVLTQQLRHDHLKHPEGIADDRIINLQRIFNLRLTGSVYKLLLLDCPTETTEELTDELRTGEVARESRVTLYLQCWKNLARLIIMSGTITQLRMLAHPEILQLSNTLLGDDTALQTLSIFAEDDGAQGSEAFQEGRVIQNLVKGDLIKLAQLSETQQVKQRRTDAKRRVRMQTVFISYPSEGLFEILRLRLFRHSV